MYKAYIIILFGLLTHTHGETDLLVLSVATQANDGYHRFMQSIEQYDIQVQVLGMGQEWLGGDMNSVGGGQKVNLLREALEEYKNDNELLVMFVDSYDVVFTSNAREIISVFKKFKSRVVFSAEGFCWPDPSLQSQYPEVEANGKRYLNSGGFIGYAPDVYAIVSHAEIKHTDDDQLYYTRVFLDPTVREKHAITLDSRSDIFQNLNGALDEVKVKFKGANSYLYNMKTGAIPIVVHGNGPVKVELNGLANYLVDSWTPTAGCQSCVKNTIDLSTYQDSELPVVYVALFVEHATPFLDLFLERVAAQQYPKSRMHLFIHYKVELHRSDIEAFLAEHGAAYRDTKVLTPADSADPAQARSQAMAACRALECGYYLSLDGEAYLEDTRAIHHLIQRNRSIVSPLLVRPGKMWSTFWGALSRDGFYKRSEDYADIVQYKKIGLWNVPFIATAYLVQGHVLPQLADAYTSSAVDYDMAFCQRAREQNLFMYVDNQEYYGFLINSENYDTSHLHNDLWQVVINQLAWEKKYLHADYHKQLEPGFVIEQPCPDVFWFPLYSPKLCSDLIEEVNNFGLWSGGKHEDSRLTGGYENVPTDDIHMNQIGYEQEWLYLLKTYVAPFNAKIFTGYYTEARAIMNFMVRYKPTVQDRLRPHHDSSTYSINVALNRVHEDYEGGGVRFTRYNCSVTKLRRGYTLMHPGRLTHEHEGLPTTAGTRYIMVSFIDP